MKKIIAAHVLRTLGCLVISFAVSLFFGLVVECGLIVYMVGWEVDLPIKQVAITMISTIAISWAVGFIGMLLLTPGVSDKS